MLKLFAAFTVLIFGLLIAFQANAGIVIWQEEVKLNDGRVIVVEQKRRCPDVPCRFSPEAWLTISLPESGPRPIFWHEKLNPIIVNIHKGALYLVARAPSCRESLLYGDPVPFYIPFRYERGQWNLIAVEEIPFEIYDVNMLIQSVPPEGTQLLTVNQKLSPSLNGKFGYQKQEKRIDLSFRGQSCRDNASNAVRRATRYTVEPRQELAMAISDSDIETVRNLLDKGVPVKRLDNDGFAPLVSAAMAAAMHPEGFKVIDLLITAGADIEQSGPTTPLDAAVRNGPPQVVTYLLDKGANVNAVASDGRTVLFQSIRRGTYAAAEILIRRGANVNIKTSEGWAPLHMAVLNGLDATVKLLLVSGADINARDKNGVTPLSYAKGNGPLGKSQAKPELIEFLISKGATE